MNMLVFRIGYMPTYDGKGTISGGGAHVEEHGEGGEMWNFRVEGGRCYGYVMTQRFAGVDLGRISPNSDWNINDELNDVDIIFIAKRPTFGQVVIGWYKGATVFHKKYRKRRGNKSIGDWEKLDYLCEVDAKQIVLLPENLRTFKVPHGKGFPGRSDVWYPHSETPEVAQFVTKLRKYIAHAQKENANAKKISISFKAKPVPLEKDLITQIEQAAISATVSHFTKEGYSVVSVEKDNRGWDLEAVKGRDRLLLEVKGHIGNVIQFELTPNEYSKLQAEIKYYRVCVVRNALDSLDVEVYVPTRKTGALILVRENGTGCIGLNEKVAARAFEAE